MRKISFETVSPNMVSELMLIAVSFYTLKEVMKETSECESSFHAEQMVCYEIMSLV